jgi:hypothetical protein
MGGNRPDGLKLYNFVDNHDVERIYTKLDNKAHFVPVHILMYTLPGIPSVYYGSEFGIEGKKQHGSDDSLRPEISYEQYVNAIKGNNLTDLISRLGKIRKKTKALSYGEYKELSLTNCQYAFSRSYNGQNVIITVNNADNDYVMTLPSCNADEYVGALFGEKVKANGGCIVVNIKANSGEIWLPKVIAEENIKPIEFKAYEKPVEKTIAKTEPVLCEEEKEEININYNKPYEEMTVEELQKAILEKMAKNGPVTDRMKKDVYENVYHNSLVTWIKSFN